MIQVYFSVFLCFSCRFDINLWIWQRQYVRILVQCQGSCGKIQAVMVLAGLISVRVIVSCTFFLSVRCKDTLTVLLISMTISASGVSGDNFVPGGNDVSCPLGPSHRKRFSNTP